MVCGRERDSERVLKSSSSSVSMALAPERTKPLHNFDLPCLKWGSQKYLRCMREVSDDGGGAGSVSDRRSDVPEFQSSLVNRRRESERERLKVRAPKSVYPNNDGKEGIAAMGEKILLEIRTVSEELKDKFLVVRDAEAEKQSAEMMPPRKLRARKVPSPSTQEVEEAIRCLGIEEMKANCSPLRSEANNGVKLTRLARGLPPPAKKERVPFSVSLSKKEIEEDFMELFGHKPPRRPKKRPRNVHRQLETLFPGLNLNDITPDTYKVPDEPETGKR